VTGVLRVGERSPFDTGDTDLAGDDPESEGLLDDPDAFDPPADLDAVPSLDDDDDYIDTSIHDDEPPDDDDWEFDGTAD